MDWEKGVPFRKRFWVVSRRADFLELGFLVFLMVSGLTQLLSGERPGSVALMIPNPIDTIWLWMLVLGCVTAIVGIFWLWKRTDSILLESIGDLAVGISVFLYGATVVVFAVKTGQPGGVLMTGPAMMLLGIGWAWRWRNLNQFLNRLRSAGGR